MIADSRTGEEHDAVGGRREPVEQALRATNRQERVAAWSRPGLSPQRNRILRQRELRGPRRVSGVEHVEPAILDRRRTDIRQDLADRARFRRRGVSTRRDEPQVAGDDPLWNASGI